MPISNNFTDIFDRNGFKGEYEEFERSKNGCVKLDKNWRPKKIKKPRTKGRVNPKFSHEHGILSNSSPVDFMTDFIPSKERNILPKKRNYQASLCLQNGPT